MSSGPAGTTAGPQSRSCEVCGSSRVALLRHSDAWSFDVGRCRDCRMVFVLDPPPASVVEGNYVDGGDPGLWDDYQREDDRVRGAVLRHLQQLLGPAPVDRPHRLFDVGAGVGEFLVLAREQGFAVSGNEISRRSVDYTREHRGLELSPLMLADQEPASVDAMTMWCVIAHVNDPEAMLADALAQLRPGGVLFLRTPRWCVIDTVATTVDRASRGRWSGLADRRMSVGHMHMYTRDNLTSLLAKVGFTDLDVRPATHFPLNTEYYLTTSGPVVKVLNRFAKGVDALIQRDRFIKNTLLVYARRPG